MDAHIKAGKGIVAAVNPLDNLVGRCLPMLLVGQCVYIGGEAGRRGGIDTGDMMINTYLK